MSQTDVAQKLWDWPVRIVHVGLIFCVAVAYATYELDMMDWHVRNGLLLLGLVIFRILWGLFGSTSARFSHFLRGPSAVLAYVRSWRQQPRQAGHNPLGGWAVLALLLVLLAQASTGLFSTDDILTDGPLRHLVETETAQRLTELHEIIYFFILLVFVAVHILANLAYRLFKGQNLITPMLTGTAPLPANAAAGYRFGLWGRAIVCAALSAACVGAIVWVGG
jgi:cytochrome b